MQLAFEHSQQLGPGSQPAVIHTPENIVQVLYVGDGGRIYAIDASTPFGEWESREFNPAYLICTDIAVQFMKLKYVSAASIFVVWKNATEQGESGTVRHRLAVWAMRQNLSDYLVQGDIEMRLDNPIVDIAIEFENPGQLVSDENDTILTPGTSLTLFFRTGNSARYIMGRYFADRNRMGATDATTTVEGRNSIGKFLRDQSFDEDNVYPRTNFGENLQAMLESFGVDNYWIGPATAEVGMEFPPNMKGLEGILEYLKTVRNWQIKEDLTGQIGIGNRSDNRFTQPSTYTFYRDTDVFTRDVDREDTEIYSKICVHNENFSLRVYRNVDFRFTMPKKKTLYVPVPENTTQSDAEEYADELAGLLSQVGVVEMFIGPFRPHIVPGDQARILASNGNKLLGIITTVRHMFGKNGQGYATEFVVDSGGRIGKPQIRDYIEKISGRQVVSGQVKRLY